MFRGLADWFDNLAVSAGRSLFRNGSLEDHTTMTPLRIIRGVVLATIVAVLPLTLLGCRDFPAKCEDAEDAAALMRAIELYPDDNRVDLIMGILRECPSEALPQLEAGIDAAPADGTVLVYVLGGIPGTDAQRILHKELKHRYRSVRVSAAIALAHRGDAAGREILVDELGQPGADIGLVKDALWSLDQPSADDPEER